MVVMQETYRPTDGLTVRSTVLQSSIMKRVYGKPFQYLIVYLSISPYSYNKIGYETLSVLYGIGRFDGGAACSRYQIG